MRIDQYPQATSIPADSYLVMETPAGTTKLNAYYSSLQVIQAGDLWKKRNMYRGKNLGNFSKAWHDKIYMQDFSDIFIGDYWTIPAGTKPYIKAPLTLYVADFNYYYYQGLYYNNINVIFKDRVENTHYHFNRNGDRTDPNLTGLHNHGCGGSMDYLTKVNNLFADIADFIGFDIIQPNHYIMDVNNIDGDIASVVLGTARMYILTFGQLYGYTPPTKLKIRAGLPYAEMHIENQMLNIFRFAPHLRLAEAGKYLWIKDDFDNARGYCLNSNIYGPLLVTVDNTYPGFYILSLGRT